MSFTSRLLGLVETNPDALFLITIKGGREDEFFTYGQVVRRARMFSRAMASRGVGPDDIVLLFLKQGLDSIAAFLGAVLLGAVPSFMPSQTDRQDPTLFWEVNARLLRHIEPRALVFEDGFGDLSRAHGQGSTPLLETSLPPIITARELDEPEGLSGGALRQESDLLLLQHSSGTTGLRKGVMLTHGAVLRQLDRYAERLGLTAEDRIVSWLPLYHDMGLMAAFLLPLLHGVPLILLDPFEWALAPRSLMSAIERHGATLTWLPNFAFNHLRRHHPAQGQIDLTSMRAFINCSEPARWDTMREFQKTFGSCGVSEDKLQVCYGMAETVFATSQTCLGEVARPLWVDRAALVQRVVRHSTSADPEATALLSNGRLLEGLEVAIFDPHGVRLAEDEVGEIALRGDFLFSGYFRRSESHLGEDGWYRTRDQGFIHARELYVLGRLDDVIISCGKNLYAHDIEAEVSALPGVSPGRVAAFAIEDCELGTQRLVVVAESKLAEPLQRNRLRLKIVERINALYQMAPHATMVVEPGWIVKTTSGKMSRSGNRDKYLSGLGNEQEAKT